jgi:hypothetical protein
MYGGRLLSRAVIKLSSQTMFISSVGLFFGFKFDVMSFINVYGK